MSLPASPSSQLGTEDLEDLAESFDAIRQHVIETRGAADAAYIRRVIGVQRRLELGSRVLLLVNGSRTAWLVGTAGLALAKILDNMEIGHNVLHGQWDWMRDPKIHSTTWEWDHATPAAEWKRSHNESHHVYTNIIGKDNDLGYGILRVAEDQPWKPRYLLQPAYNLLNAVFFEYGVAGYDLDLGENLRAGRGLTPELRQRAGGTLRKVGRQMAKDFVLHPLLSGTRFRRTLAANATASLVRNLWSHSVIMCGHFPEGVETFEQDQLDEAETRGQWYLRQMMGSANISGSPLLHLLTGNLSHQIEHHLFPDLPSNRYAQIAPAVRRVFERHGLRYHVAPLPRQVGSAWHKVVRLSLPNDWLAQTTLANLPQQLAKLWRAHGPVLALTQAAPRTPTERSRTLPARGRRSTPEARPLATVG